MRLIIFGTGKYYLDRKEYFKGAEILAFIDNSEEKKGSRLDGIPVLLPSEAIALDFERIYLMSRNYQGQMKRQLLGMGVSEYKIFNFMQISSVSDFSKSKVYNQNGITNKNGKKTVLMFSHQLSNTGAPIALFYAALTIKEFGFQPIIVSFEDGELRPEIVAAGIPVVIDEDISIESRNLRQLIGAAELFWINTAVLGYLVMEFEKLKKPVVWWLHECGEAYQDIPKDDFPFSICSNVDIYAVSDIAEAGFRAFGGQGVIRRLLYGIPDVVNVSRDIRKAECKVIFALIGTFCKIKAQDIFIDAIKYLSVEERRQCEFLLLGNVFDVCFYEKIRGMAEGISEIKLRMAVSHEEMMEIYSKYIDVVVCPSREDSMPIVLTEAMMFRKVCIASDKTGTASNLTEKKSGLICKTGSAKSLAAQMRWILQNTNEAIRIGCEARKLYEKQFSMEHFSESISGVLQIAEGKMDVKDQCIIIKGGGISTQ